MSVPHRRRPAPPHATAAALRPPGWPARLGLLLLLLPLAAGSARAEHDPTALPDARDPGSLWRALDDEGRARVEENGRVVTFAVEQDPEGAGLRMTAWSVGVLDHPPEAVKGLLSRTGEYPSWVPLNPTYKSVRLGSSRTLYCEVGRASSRRSKEQLTYHVNPTDDGVEWVLSDSRTPLQPGSRLTWVVAPHPTRDGASLVAHGQEAILPDTGRLTRYLTSEDDEERNRFWKDASKHSYRLHWAMDAALRHPGGPERFEVYVDHYQRAFGGLPYWAQ